MPRSLRSGASIVAALFAVVAIELTASFWQISRNDESAALAIRRALAATPASDRDLYLLHRALSRGEPRADPELVMQLLDAADPRVREFAALPTLSKFGHAEAVEFRFERRQRPREAFRQRLWHYYQLGVHEPPRFLSIERIREHFASLDDDPYAE